MSLRLYLQNVTNVRETLAGKRPSTSQGGGPNKKPKLAVEDSDSDSDSESLPTRLPPPRKILHSKPGRYTTPYSSLTPLLRSFVSCNKSDIFRCQSIDLDAFLTPPYSCAYSHDAKRGGIPLLAVATEQGSVHIWETSKRNPWDPEPLKSTLQPHTAGIFDVKWNESDELLATCCGDRTARISNVATSTTLQTLGGHEGTVKVATWDPNHRDLLSTGGRDGLICVWDLRSGEGRTSDKLSPVLTITKAHEANPAPRKSLKAVPKSVTGVIYSPTSANGLISGGSADGILRCWDLRSQTNTKKSKRILPVHVSPVDPTLSHGQRARGLPSLQSGAGPTGGVVFALGTNARIYTYSLPTLEPLKINYTHCNLQTTAFYVGLSLSPCGQWLAAGSVGTSASTFLFDVSSAAQPFASPCTGVQLKAPAGEVGAVEWGKDMLATCGDDGIVRIWRPDIETYNRCLQDPNDMQWDWSCSRP